jgi:hypothetical protein
MQCFLRRRKIKCVDKASKPEIGLNWTELIDILWACGSLSLKTKEILKSRKNGSRNTRVTEMFFERKIISFGILFF